jgi:hypothetical protein
MLADALPTSHPVVQHHNGDIKSIIESFDVITYGKVWCTWSADDREMDGLGQNGLYRG